MVVVILCLTDRRVWQQGISNWWQQIRSGLSKRVCYGTFILSFVALLSLMVLLPTYLSFKTFYECGYPLSQMSVSYLEGSLGEWILAVSFVVYVVTVLLCVMEHLRQGILARLKSEESAKIPTVSSDEKASSIVVRPPWWKRVIGITGILLVCLVCTIPSAIYVMLNSLPEDNILVQMPHQGTFLGILLTPFLVLCSQFIFPRVCLLSGRYEYPTNMSRAIHVGSRRYLVICTLFSTVIPFIVLLLWDGGCLSGFMNIWEPCTNDSFIVKVCSYRLPNSPESCSEDRTCEKGL